MHVQMGNGLAGSRSNVDPNIESVCGVPLENDLTTTLQSAEHSCCSSSEAGVIIEAFLIRLIEGLRSCDCTAEVPVPLLCSALCSISGPWGSQRKSIAAACSGRPVMADQSLSW